MCRTWIRIMLCVEFHHLGKTSSYTMESLMTSVHLLTQFSMCVVISVIG